MARVNCSIASVGLVLLLVDVSELGMGQERVFLQSDGLLVVGGGLVETAALESNEAAVDQEHILELVVGRLLESLEGLLEIRLGLLELEIRPIPSGLPRALDCSLTSF